MSRADKLAEAARRRFVIRAGKPKRASGLRVKRVELVLRERPVAPSKLDRHIIEAAGREASIKMPQAGNDHAHHGDLDIWARLIEHEEIEPGAPRDLHARGDLLAHIESAEFRGEVRTHRRSIYGRQIRMVLQPKGSGSL